MLPTNRELLDAIAVVLREHIAPLVADQPWPASELRSIDLLLALVADRVEHEADVLAADNAALDQLLAELTAAGIHVAPVDLGEGASLRGRNTALRSALDRTLPALHDGEHDGQVAAVRAYLVAAVEREQVLYGRLSGRPFF